MSESETDEQVVKPKRAPRKRVAKTAPKKTTPKPRKTAVRKTTAQQAPKKTTPTESKTAEPPVRKAPTVFASKISKQKQRRNQLIVIGMILCVGVGASAAVGYTDKGQIDVAQVVEERNERVRTGNVDTRDDAADRVEVPVQNTNRSANGGLVGLGTGGAKPPEPPVEVATSTASSTEPTATSTDAVASSTELALDQPEAEDAEPEESAEVPIEEDADIVPVVTDTATSS